MTIIVALGDSLTAGYIDPIRRMPYTRFLEELIRREIGVDVTLINAGVPGDTTEGMLRRFETDVLAHEANYAIIWGGINDLHLGRSPGEVVANLLELYKRSRAGAVTPIGCMLTPTRSEVLNQLVREVNEDLSRRCRDEGVPIADLYSPLIDISGLLNPSFSSDGIHLNPAGYRVVAEIIYRVFRSLIGGDPR